MDEIDQRFLEFIISCDEKFDTKVYNLNDLNNEDNIIQIKYDTNGGIVKIISYE
jgi:hypothetical protein